MTANLARFDHVSIGEPLDLTDVYEGTWQELRLLEIAAGEVQTLDAAGCQFLVFVLAGTGVVRWEGKSLEAGPGSALGVPLGEALELEGSGQSTFRVAALQLAGQ